MIVVHGMPVTGKYDNLIPIAWGAITPKLPAVRASSGSGTSTAGYG